MIDSLKEPGGECSASIGGVTITSAREAAGISFSYPTLASSLGILVQARPACLASGPACHGGGCGGAVAAAANAPRALSLRPSLSLSPPVQSTTQTSDGWGFTRPFSWELWVALLATLLL